jgi:ferredoxin hydrogenase large subunit
MSYFQVNDQCNGCLACVENCPSRALKALDDDNSRTILHNMSRCARCANCWRICPQDAIEFQYILINEWDRVASLELLHCRICGEPIYTVPFGQTLSEKLGQTAEPLCPRHVDSISSLARAHALPGHQKNKVEQS